MHELQVIGDVAGGKKWLGCYDNQTRAPPPSIPPWTWIMYTISVDSNPPTPPPTRPYQAAQLIGIRKWFSPCKKKKKKSKLLTKTDEGPFETHIYSSTTTNPLLSIRYSYRLRNGAYGRHANSLQTSAIHFSPQPHKPIVLETRAWPQLSLALPFSSSLFDSEEGSGRRRSSGAVEGASVISPSLRVLNSLMKFRSEEQWCKHSHPTCLSVFLSISAFLCLSPCINSVFDLVSVIVYPPVLCRLILH